MATKLGRRHQKKTKPKAMTVAKGDTVEVISGDGAGTRGKVLKVFPDKQRVIVEKVNLVKRHQKPSQQNPTGGILEKEAPIHVSNVMLLDPGSGERTRVGFKRLEDGGKERVSRKSGEMIQRND